MEHIKKKNTCESATLPTEERGQRASGAVVDYLGASNPMTTNTPPPPFPSLYLHAPCIRSPAHRMTKRACTMEGEKGGCECSAVGARSAKPRPPPYPLLPDKLLADRAFDALDQNPVSLPFPLVSRSPSPTHRNLLFSLWANGIVHTQTHYHHHLSLSKGLSEWRLQWTAAPPAPTRSAAR